jgi:hypothetical protein
LGISTKLVKLRLKVQLSVGLCCVKRLRCLLLFLLQLSNFRSEVFLRLLDFLLERRNGVCNERLVMKERAWLHIGHGSGRNCSCDAAFIRVFGNDDFAGVSIVGKRMDWGYGMGCQGEGEKERECKLHAQHCAS